MTKVRKVYTLITVLCSLAGQALAQAPGLVDEWPAGRVFLTSGDTLVGKITYHRAEDMVKIGQPDGGVVAYAPVNLRGFEAVADGGRFRRVFVTQGWSMGNDYSDFLTPAFFEQIVIGRYGLLRRESITRRDISRDNTFSRTRMIPPEGAIPMGPIPPTGMNGPIMVDKRIDSYYILLPNGRVKELRKVKKDLDTIFGKKRAQMKSYIKQNKLKYNNLPDLAKIVTFFGSISTTDTNS